MYKLFAKYYDELMEQVPYNEWAAYMDATIREHGVKAKPTLKHMLLVELGCGTGNMSIQMSRFGYDVIGVDNSDEMLSIAKGKALPTGINGASVSPILYINQDMRYLDLYGSVDAIISVCDSMNYLIDVADLEMVFAKAYYFLNPGGLFAFDLNTEFKFKHILGEATYAEQYDNYTYIWENYFDEEAYINEYHLTFFIKDGKVFHRFEETHYEKAYDTSTIVALLEKSGFQIVDFNGDMGGSELDTAERHYYIAKKPEHI